MSHQYVYRRLGESVIVTILLPFSCAISQPRPDKARIPDHAQRCAEIKKGLRPLEEPLEDPRVGWRDAFTGLVNRVFCDAEALVLYIRMFTAALRLPLCPV